MPTDVTVTIKSSGGDYTGLQDFQNNYPDKDLVTQDIRLFVECDNLEESLGSGKVLIDGWTTDLTRYIHVYANTQHDSTFRVTTNAYRLTNTGTTGALDIKSITTAAFGDPCKIIFEGIQVTCTSGAGSAAAVLCHNLFLSVTHVYFVRCVIDGAAYGIWTDCFQGSIHLMSCWVWGQSRPCYVEDGDDFNIYHCTCAGGAYAVGVNNVNVTVNVTNSYLYGGTSSIQVWAGTLNVLTTATNDADGDIPNVAYDATNFVDVTLQSEDLHILVGATDLIGAGTDLSANDWPLNCPHDIDSGDTTTASPDVGADEYDSTGTLLGPGGVRAPLPYEPPIYNSPDNTFRDDFPYLKPKSTEDYYAGGPPPPDVMDWVGGASW